MSLYLTSKKDPVVFVCLRRSKILSATFLGVSKELVSSLGKFFRRKEVSILPGIRALICRSGRSSASPWVKFKTAAFALEYKI